MFANDRYLILALPKPEPPPDSDPCPQVEPDEPWPRH